MAKTLAELPKQRPIELENSARCRNCSARKKNRKEEEEKEGKGGKEDREGEKRGRQRS